MRLNIKSSVRLVPDEQLQVILEQAVKVLSATPFTVQGTENGLTLEGGYTLAYEMVSQLLRREATLDAVFIQVGGGALASSLIQGFRDARALGLVERLPRFYTVQTEGGFPLYRAWSRVAARVLGPSGDVQTGDEERPDPRIDDDRARRLAGADTAVAEALRYAAQHRAEFMWPWETTPKSIATGILDDETYDWLAVVRGMMETGGFPIVVSEDRLRASHELAHETTAIPVDPTGSAGLAGCIDLRETGLLPDTAVSAVLFTGVER